MRPFALRIGVDTGGTFTDFHVLAPAGSLVFKIPSTPADPASAVLEGLRRILEWAAGGGAATELAPRSGGSRRIARRVTSNVPTSRLSIVHGTTVGTNALLTRRIARTAFVTTAGFEDLVEIGRQNRESLYDLNADRPSPLVPRELRFGVGERVFPPVGARQGYFPPGGKRDWPGREGGRPERGRRVGKMAAMARSVVWGSRGVVTGLIVASGTSGSTAEEAARGGARIAPPKREIEKLARRLRSLGVESIAVGFLHSYLDPANERLVGRILEKLGLPVTLSHRISEEYREYERFSTAIANAALQPVVGRYVGRLAAGMGSARLTILQSDGTTATATAAAKEPARTVLSGPAGGALAARHLSRRLEDPCVLSFDMGGTSTDVVLVDGELPRAVLGRIAGLPVRTPMIEVRTVGAGGGSIARRDAAGALRVGPESAGADPGPACYGISDRPTVTDAHLVLGRLGANDLLGGEFPVDAVRSRRAVSRLARALGLDAMRTAEGILEVVEATMEHALRAISMERGRDPRGYALYAFGGSGGLHACALADRLGIRRIVVPPAPGVFSATGLSAATPGVEVSATLLASPGDASRLRSGFESLERRALARLRDQGISAAGVRIERLADLRYQGQSHEIAVPFGPRMARRFEAEHRGRYGHVRAGAPIEVVTIRLRGTQPEERRVSAGRLPVALRSGSSAPSPDRLEDARNGPAARGHLAPVHFRRARVMCRVLPRESIPPGKTVRGPARVTEYSATTFIPPGWKGRLGPEGALVLTPSPARGARRSRGAPSMRGRA